MQQTPDDKSPGGTVPKSAQKHDNDEIQRGAKWPDLIAAERNVKVIAQESGKRNVPAPPKIREPDRGVGKSKVVLQMEAESQSRPDGASRVTGEIEKYLSGKRDHPRPRIERDQRPGITEDAVG